MSVRVERFGGAAAEWDAFVRGARGWTHNHLYGWRDVVARVFGHETEFLAARGADGALRGVLPLVHVRSVVFGRFLVSMPFVNYGGPLGNDEAVRALADAAVARGRAARVSLVELRSRIALPLALPVSHRKITVTLPLPSGDVAPLWRSFASKLRSQVRRAQREGVVVRFGPDQVAPFYGVFSRHMRDLGTPTLPARFFDAIAATFRDDVVFACAWLDGQPIAAGCGFLWGDEFEMTWASALVEFKRTSANMELYWRCMELAAGRGATTFNFGRCSPGGGTHRFKQQWGGHDEPLHWYQHSVRGTRATPSPDEGAYSWGPRVWKHLPLPVASAIGPRIVRGIP